MKVKEIRELSTEEINKKLVETKEELFNLTKINFSIIYFDFGFSFFFLKRALSPISAT